MKIILTERCCGKSFLAERNSNFIDFDIFTKFNKTSLDFIKTVIEAYIPTCDESKVYLMNVFEFYRFGMNKMNVDIIGMYLPELTDESIGFRVHNFYKRDLKKYNFVREKEIESLISKYEFAYEKAKELNIPVIELKRGEFLEDYIGQTE